MNVEEIGIELASEFAVIARTPWIYAASLCVVSIVVWRILEWRYAGTIERLKNDLQGLRPKVRQNVVAAASLTKVSPPDSTLYDMRVAADLAGLALAERTTIAAELGMPRMRAALLSAEKAYGLAIPTEEGHAKENLSMGKRFIGEVLPFLRAGHLDEARACAQRLVNGSRSA